MRATVPIAAYTAWRFRNRKLVPYSMAEDTELADSTITRPIPVSRNAAASMTTTVRGMGSRRSRRRRRVARRSVRRARTRSRNEGWSSSRTTRSAARSGRSVRVVRSVRSGRVVRSVRSVRSVLPDATGHPFGRPAAGVASTAVVASRSVAGRPVRQGPGRRGESLAPLRVVPEHVLAGAGRGQEHGTARRGHGEGLPRGLFDRVRPPNGDPPIEDLQHLGRGLPDGHHPRRRDPVAGGGGGQRGGRARGAGGLRWAGPRSAGG